MSKISYIKSLLVVSFIFIVVGVGYAGWGNFGNSNKFKNPNNTLAEPGATNNPKASEIDTSDWKIYRNKQYGFEVKYPNEWAITEDLKSPSSGELFNFFTTHGYKGIFGINHFPPYQGDPSIEEYKKIYSKGNSKVQQHDILIGSVPGFETGGMLCEVGNPCVAKFESLSTVLLKKGFNFYLVISDLGGIRPTSTLTYGHDPYLLLKEEVMIARKVLSTFQVTD